MEKLDKGACRLYTKLKMERKEREAKFADSTEKYASNVLLPTRTAWNGGGYDSLRLRLENDVFPALRVAK